MRHLTFLLASSAAIIGAAALIVALVGTHGRVTPYIVAIAAFIALGATTRAIRTARQPNP